jgi:transposase/predicted XRE-type DNA-binding protein
MNKIRETIRLHQEAGLSNRQIARTLGISRPSVSQYLTDYRSSGLSYSAIAAMSDDELVGMLEGVKIELSERYQDLSARFEYFVKELKRTGVTLDLLWHEYKREKPGGYNRTQFCHHFQVWRETDPELTMHLEHKAGDKMFVDYPGKKMMVYDRRTGEGREVELLVAILGASQLTYAEATESQRKEDWIKANGHALRYFGGVTQAIVPDCLKSAVDKTDKYEPDINPEYADFARYHDTVILPARPATPKDKALAENAVKLVYQRVFAPLRDRIFYSLEEVNEAIGERLEVHNHTPFQRMKICRWELFEQTERHALKPLRPEAYELRRFLDLKVQFNYHIYFSPDKHYYSVPWRYSAKRVTVIYTTSSVEIYHKNIRIALHLRDYSANRYTTTKEHMPPHHLFYDSWSPQKMIGWAEAIGPQVKAMIEAVLESRPYPEQAYKACLGILNLARKYGKERLNEACARGLEYRCYSYRSVRNILENNLDKLRDRQSNQQELPLHENIRGTEYFQ